MTRHPATAALTAAAGFALTALAIFWPLVWWAIPAHIVGILALAVGAHGLVAAEDPPRHQAGRRTPGEVWPPARRFLEQPHLHDDDDTDERRAA